MTQDPITSDPCTQPDVPWKILGLTVHRKIRTGEKHLAWSSVFMLTLIWFTYGINIFATGTALMFTINKYNSDPRIIAMVTSIAGLLMIGPFISYLSDQVWTRVGRRRPFVIVSWLGGFLTFVSYAFLPQISGAINHALVAVGLFPVGELIIIVTITFTFGKMGDFGTPLEPLFLECVPPHQRGRFWAIRGMMFTLAMTIFFQVLWPKFDMTMDSFAWCGHPGVLRMTGEQTIYIMAAALYFLSGLFLVFCVEETRMPQAPNKSIRTLLLGERKTSATILAAPVAGETVDFMTWVKQIPIITFAIKFAKDVFLKKENLPFYIILIIPTIEVLVWGGFGQLMQDKQFGYSKQSQADWAFPMQILTFFLITPFAGWYSDVRSNIRWWWRILMLVVSVATFIAMLWVLKNFSPADIRQPPGFLILSWVTALAALSMVSLYVPMVETLLDFVGREHARAWVTLLTIVKGLICTVILYILIQSSSEQVLPIMIWMAFGAINGTMGALMATFIGPMIYDYMPRSQMGTINSGHGIIGAIVKIGAVNLGAWWVVFSTNHFHKPVHGEFDYTSLYLLQFVLFIPAIIAKVYFVWLVVSGRLKKWGTMEVEEPEEALKEEKEAGACD